MSVAVLEQANTLIGQKVNGCEIVHVSKRNFSDEVEIVVDITEGILDPAPATPENLIFIGGRRMIAAPMQESLLSGWDFANTLFKVVDSHVSEFRRRFEIDSLIDCIDDAHCDQLSITPYSSPNVIYSSTAQAPTYQGTCNSYTIKHRDGRYEMCLDYDGSKSKYADLGMAAGDAKEYKAQRRAQEEEAKRNIMLAALYREEAEMDETVDKLVDQKQLESSSIWGAF